MTLLLRPLGRNFFIKSAMFMDLSRVENINLHTFFYQQNTLKNSKSSLRFNLETMTKKKIVIDYEICHETDICEKMILITNRVN